MPSKISFQTWSGGSGMGDKSVFLGYCKEEPKDVLKQIYKTHYIYHYRDLYRPVDWSFPNNVAGLIIEDIGYEKLRDVGIIDVLSLEEININIGLGENINRNQETFNNAIDAAIKWHVYDVSEITDNDHKNRLLNLNQKMLEQIKEVKSVILE